VQEKSFEVVNPQRANVLACLERHGVAVVRQALPAEPIRRLGEMFLRWYEDNSPGAAAIKADCEAWKWRTANGFNFDVKVNDVRFLFSIFYFFQHSCLRDAMCDWLGCRNLGIPEDHALACIRLPGDNTAFHQDGVYVVGAFCANVWIPLVDVDESCSQLALYSPPLSFLDVNPPQLQNDRLAFAAKHDLTLVCPTLAKGDVILFNNNVLHGSLAGQRTRCNLEFRLGDADKIPQVYREKGVVVV